MLTPWRQLRERSRARVRSWALRRQGYDAARVTLASRRIYILPTAPGLVFAAMIATMLAGAMNYNNNLGFALAFLLAGVGIVAIYHSHRTLAGLHVHYLGTDPAYAGDPAQSRIALVNDTDTPRDEVFVDWADGAPVAGGTGALDARTVLMPLPTSRRGLQRLPGLRISTRGPLGLTRAWAWVHLDEQAVVYPRPADTSPPAAAPSGISADGLAHPGEEDFAGLRPWRPGDPPRRVAWRASARTGTLMVRDYRGGALPDEQWIDWDALPSSDIETRVSRLARLVLDAAAAGLAWGLRVPGTTVPPGRGPEHLHRCLRVLSTAGLVTP